MADYQIVVEETEVAPSTEVFVTIPAVECVEPDPILLEVETPIRIVVGELGLSVVKVDFDYLTSSPLFIASLPSNACVLRADVVVTTDFDDNAATLALTTVSSGDILSTSEIKPGKIGQYNTLEIFRPSVADTVQLSISPGSSTQGAGFVIVHILEQ